MSALSAPANFEAASHEKIGGQPEIAYCLGREHKAKGHAHGACVRASRATAHPLPSVDEIVNAVAGRKLAKCHGLQLLGVHSPTRRVDALRQFGARA